ncbi:uncharacterized protein EHS24_001508 [Apiotrichum porosum]|uniref:IMS import disulfide relay-system CHCH-CHCH-like Cx9C domain-containing protein n=1 Tax=Apiotrichum porosum TaxID=105984 RepID=A0A427XKU5_9TREE|nr:uncharacterized protein EHS24_001508 [Apiotrichum porosum]RSH79458.1 hypothetical protein EHS24_001508 [Apiotrichum porosum]
MDFSFDLVASKCAEQMAKYQQNGDWSTICRPEGKALTACADASVPHLADVKRHCANPILNYRACLEANASETDEAVREKCSAPLKALWDCTESRRAEIAEQSNNN